MVRPGLGEDSDLRRNGLRSESFSGVECSGGVFL
jgi:hypothetical protein